MNVSSPQFAEVVYLEPIEGRYDYRIPGDLEGLVQPGMRVLVPMRRQFQTAVVVRLHDTPGYDPGKIKAISDLLDDGPLISPSLMRLGEWLAEYYLCPLGLVLRSFYPPGTQVRSKTMADLAEDVDLDDIPNDLSPLQRRLVDLLGRVGEVSLQWLAKKLDQPAIHYHARRLADRGIVRLRVATGETSAKPLRLKAVRATPEMGYKAMLAALNQTNAFREEFLKHLAANPEWHFVTELDEIFPKLAGKLKSLEKLGVIETAMREKPRNPFASAVKPYPAPERLTDEQQAILDTLRRELAGDDKRKPHLILGVTGSGKTEVYLQAIQATLDVGKEAIVLVPEISLTPQVVARFRGRFGDRVAVLHSALSVGERFDEFHRIHRGEAQIAIGARSAIFAPFRNLGIIVVDEEQDTSYKQDKAPAYNGRDVAVVRAHYEGASLVLGSATPSLESFHNAETGRYHLHRLRKRVQSLPLPPVEVVNLQEAYERKEVQLGFAEPVYRSLQDTLDRGEQAMIYLNRRGYETSVTCGDCGAVRMCPHCSVALTYHKSGLEVRCHYCGHLEPPPEVCHVCKSPKMSYRGSGTQKIEETIATLFPMARIARMDSDALSRKGSHEALLRRIANLEVDIIVGTKMLTKGHDFPKVTLVVIVSVDAMIHRPDFRAAEQAFQEVTQMAGRAGRSGLEAKVYLQTFLPDHYAIATSRKHDFGSFAEQELTARRALGYPPFSFLVSLEVKGLDEELIEAQGEKLGAFLRERCEGIDIRGPAPCLIYKLKDMYRFQLLLLHQSRKQLRFAARQAQEYGKLNGLELRVDVDPLSFF